MHFSKTVGRAVVEILVLANMTAECSETLFRALTVQIYFVRFKHISLEEMSNKLNTIFRYTSYYY
jgi:hypothetical protein